MKYLEEIQRSLFVA
jgi:hypothetical protein